MEQNKNISASGADHISDVALAAVATLAGLEPADRQAALRLLGGDPTRRAWTPRILGEMPTLTALVRERDREAVYSSPAWAAAYRPVRTTVVYVVQSSGLARLSADLDGVSLAKIGTSTPQTIERRIARLGVAEYGAWIRIARRYEREPGFAAFTPAPRLQLARQHAMSPVALSSLGIEVGLPANLTPCEFEADLNRLLLPLRLQTIADTAAGRALRARTDPARLRRFYRCGSTRKAATEITLMRPQADLGALAKACADIVIDVVLGLRRRRPAR